MRLTRRGWTAVTALAMLVAFGVGTAITTGDDPCGYAITTVQCP